MKVRNWRTLERAAAAGVAMLASLASISSAPAEEKITIESLTKAGWQVAGYTSAFDNRSAFILFRHPSEQHLVQCLAGYDVTRNPRVYTHCYELR
jgi:hypothetical protein